MGRREFDLFAAARAGIRLTFAENAVNIMLNDYW
jgi:hypothetical protein